MRGKLLTYTILLLITINIFFSSWNVLHGNILFHTDIARDFLLIEDIYKNHKLTLIGQHSGGIPGFFHGPAWLYLNLPAFAIGHGDPVVVGWFWVVLSAISLIIVYYVANKLFNTWTGLLSALLLSIFAVGSTHSLFNPFGAVLLSPLFFYLFYLYILKLQIRYLVLSLFILGLIIQFQIAFGLPILLLVIGFLFFFLLRKKKLRHLFSLGILVIPFSTYILFEIRHNFLQIHSFMNYINGKENHGKQELGIYLLSRTKGIFNDGINLMPGFLNLIITGIFIYLIYNIYTRKIKNHKTIYLLYFYFYIGFWLISFLFKGVIWGYYYWPFLPLTTIIFSSLYSIISKKLFICLYLYILVTNFYSDITGILATRKSIGTDGASWKFNYKMAGEIYADKRDTKDFGYYIFTPDLFGYSEHYAMDFTQTTFKTITAYPYQKKKITYLIIAPPPTNRLFLDGVWWKTNQVKITQKPVWIKKYSNGERVEKYVLTEAQQAIPSDPNLITSPLSFR